VAAATAISTTAYPVDAAQVIAVEVRPATVELAGLTPARFAARRVVADLGVATPQEIARETTEVLADINTTRAAYRTAADGLSSVAATREVTARVSEARIREIFERAGLGQGRSIGRGGFGR